MAETTTGILALTDFSGAWAIEQTAFASLQAIAARIGFGNRDPIRDRSSKTLADGILIIDVRGPMTKGGSMLTRSSAQFCDEVAEAMEDPLVKGTMILIDSPGGAIAGAHELSDAVAALSARKPTVAFIEDTACGTSLWFASQCRMVFANTANATVGGVGVSIGIYDRSKAAEKDGVVPVLIRTGALKGAGFPGAGITDAQIAMWQSLLNSSFELMSSAIRRARPGITSAQWASISQGGVFTAQRAIELGLVDKVCRFDAAVAELRSMISPKKETTTMTTTTFSAATPTPAVSALESWEASIAAVMKGGKSRADALRHVMATNPDLHRNYLAEYNEKHGTQRSNTTTAVASASARPATSGTATRRWDAAIASLVGQGRSRHAATREVIASNPSLHREYLAEANKR